MEEHLEIDKKQIHNKKSSAKLFGLILLVAISGISFKIAINNTFDSTSPPENIQIANEQENVDEDNELAPSITIIPSPSPIITSEAQAQDVVSGSGSQLTAPPSGSICGSIDINRNGIVDNEDWEDFKSLYGSSCAPQNLVMIDKCGIKDFNNDSVIDISDFVNFINKMRLASCE